jgi:hypothetical protein
MPILLPLMKNGSVANLKFDMRNWLPLRLFFSEVLILQELYSVQRKC